MGDTGSQRWFSPAILAGALYLAASLISAVLAGSAQSSPMRFFWRLSAFIIAGLVIAAHTGYEYLRLRNAARLTAWHVGLGGALGGLGIALAANTHDLGSAAGYRPRMLIALVAWPLLTAVPAFVVALVIAAGLGMTRPRR